MGVMTSNIVATFNLKKSISLEEAVTKLRNAEYNPKVRSTMNRGEDVAIRSTHCPYSRSKVHRPHFQVREGRPRRNEADCRRGYCGQEVCFHSLCGCERHE